MTSFKRYANAFDDDEIMEDVNDDEVVHYITDDDDDYCGVIETKKEEKEPYDHEKHLIELNKKYTKSLEECHEIIKDKLTWVSSFVVPPVQSGIIESKVPPSSPNWTVAKKKERKLKFGKGVPFDINIRYGNISDFQIIKPEIIPSVVNNKLCKYIAENKKCPFGNKCKYSHEYKRSSERNRMLTVEGKTKKIWMCKSYASTGKCRYGNDCAYAHDIEEVKLAVSECSRGLTCQKIKRIDSEYKNVGERICMRLHPRERIVNFITRTSS